MTIHIGWNPGDSGVARNFEWEGCMGTRVKGIEGLREGVGLGVFRPWKGYALEHFTRFFESRALSATPPPDFLTDFVSDLDESQNWSLGKVGEVSPQCPRGYATGRR